MNVSITFRHMDSTDSLKAYVQKKVERLQKFLRQPMAARATLALDRHLHEVELQIQSGSEHYEAKDASDDAYASIDRVTDKLLQQIRTAHGVESTRRRKETDLRHADWSPVAVAAGGR
ncbi:MAG: ribosomal subunit interface protein [Sorangiineae bacterium NIC37A_2]|jgi:putative sigma-54 modulation protein|nr:MAG: ribosomal subunit interface protein [Sorangiineae bacterium NIC37A_2]